MGIAPQFQLRAVAALTLAVLNATATERFVSPGGGHVAPFTSWADAATNIQAAIDAAANGDTVTVTNGLYDFGGKVMAGDLTNRIAVDKPITVQSVNGPAATIIQGVWDPVATNGPGAVRCAWLTNGATLSGFTLRGGATRRDSNNPYGISTNSGGGVWSASTGSLVTNCIVAGNAAECRGGGVYLNTVINSLLLQNVLVTSSTANLVSGGGAYGSILKNCALVANRTPNNYNTYGGGAYYSALTNCTVTGNFAYYSGGIHGSSATPVINSIIWNNSSSGSATNYGGGLAVSYSCSSPLPVGTGNISSDPQFISDGIHLASTSLCRGAGSALYITGSDIDGQSWSNPPSMGCDEWSATPMILSPLSVLPGPQGQLQLSTLAVGQDPLACVWTKDGVALEGARYGGLATTRLLINGFGPDDAGNYSLIVSNSSGASTSQVAQVVMRCVSLASVAPAAPYTNWLTAATNIQTAIDAAAVGDIVLVTNGVYNVGGKVMAGDLTNRVALDKALIVMSVNGLANTTIEARPGFGGVNFNSSGSPNGTNAVRAAWLADGAILSGFTVRGGGTRVSTTAAGASTNSGGGVWCASPGALVTYCLIQENSAYYQGGGVYGGTLRNCSVYLNGAGQEPAYQFYSFSSGGGAFNSTLVNCLIRVNQSGGSGGGAYGGTLVNCSVVNNSVHSLGGNGPGAKDSIARNCLFWNNSGNGVNFDYSGSTMTYSRAGYLVSGTGNITNNPLFLPDSVHLSSASPCRSAGNPAYASGTDIDGQSWTNPPSMGCDEWQPEPLLLSFRMQANSFDQFDFTTYFAGIESSPVFWFKDSAPLSNGAHYQGVGSPHLSVKGISAVDRGSYQLVVSNAFGMATSRVAKVVIHFVNAANGSGTPPYTNWATAASVIQNAIDAASVDAIILVTNGLYNTDGKLHIADVNTNRVVVDKPLTVVSVNGPLPTIIEGRWDPVSIIGSNAVRCVLLTSNSGLSGFTIRNGASSSFGFGGGLSADQDVLVSSCIISNNRANSGGGGAGGTYYNCWFVKNSAISGGASFHGKLSNCSVVENMASSSAGGVYFSTVTNSIIWHNSAPSYGDGLILAASSSCSPALGTSSGNLTNNPQLVDGLHVAENSPCRGAGANTLFAATDFDGDAWLSPPSIGCDEFYPAGLLGPLAVSIETPMATAVVNRPFTLIGRISGAASGLDWSFGDGPTVTNLSYYTTHAWTNPGDYLVTFRGFNSDHPGGVATNLLVHVDPVFPPALSGPTVTGPARFLFQFNGQAGVGYSVDYATNLAAPIIWFTLKSLTSTGGIVQINDTAATNSARFYRVKVP